MATSESMSASGDIGDVGVAGLEAVPWPFFTLPSTVEAERLSRPPWSSLMDVGLLRLSWLVREVRDGRRTEYTVLTDGTSPKVLIAYRKESLKDHYNHKFTEFCGKN